MSLQVHPKNNSSRSPRPNGKLRYSRHPVKKPRRGTSGIRTSLSISPQLGRKICKEATLLGIQPEAYLRILLSISSALTHSFPEQSKLDITAFGRLVEHPLFPILMQWMMNTTLSTITDAGENPEQSSPPVNKPVHSETAFSQSISPPLSKQFPPPHHPYEGHFLSPMN
ncbi:hypothetical protein D2Q93_02970 [Alicyclobacillaceae bacterium I2511]|nr:hypothetical protein D2Q93_02970 [Alicyclobacillaceae bacterium I2511]